jgi:hypothetical protein
MRIEIVKATEVNGRKYFVGQRMDVTPEKREEIGEAAQDFTGNEFASRKKKKIKLSQLKK